MFAQTVAKIVTAKANAKDINPLFFVDENRKTIPDGRQTQRNELEQKDHERKQMRRGQQLVRTDQMGERQLARFPAAGRFAPVRLKVVVAVAAHPEADQAALDDVPHQPVERLREARLFRIVDREREQRDRLARNLYRGGGRLPPPAGPIVVRHHVLRADDDPVGVARRHAGHLLAERVQPGRYEVDARLDLRPIDEEPHRDVHHVVVQRGTVHLLDRGERRKGGTALQVQVQRALVQRAHHEREAEPERQQRAGKVAPRHGDDRAAPEQIERAEQRHAYRRPVHEPAPAAGTPPAAQPADHAGHAEQRAGERRPDGRAERAEQLLERGVRPALRHREQDARGVVGPARLQVQAARHVQRHAGDDQIDQLVLHQLHRAGAVARRPDHAPLHLVRRFGHVHAELQPAGEQMQQVALEPAQLGVAVHLGPQQRVRFRLERADLQRAVAERGQPRVEMRLSVDRAAGREDGRQLDRRFAAPARRVRSVGVGAHRTVGGGDQHVHVHDVPRPEGAEQSGQMVGFELVDTAGRTG
uniref:Uncharacterized protein n=1 Tax=Anopheles merus TaxID=30066 RepID=A0A182URZ6_ANOME